VRSDLELLEAWGSGELAAGNALFERYLDVLYRFFRSKVRDDVSDLVQQTLLACVEGRGRLRSGASFRAYLFQTARHQLYGHYRRRKREAQIDFMRTTAVDLGTSPSHLAAQRQEERILLYALQRVPLESQLLLELVYQEELSSFEIAEVFGTTAAAVRGRLARAVEQLRVRITEHAEEPTKSQHRQDLPHWVRRLFEDTAVEGPRGASHVRAELTEELDR
jgi:RNA polymerase sigma-70 factor (ECF subfamily)